MSFNLMLNQKCNIARKTSTKNDYNMVVNSYTTLYEDVRCRIDYQFVTSAYLSQTPNGQIAGNDYIGYFSASVDIQIGDRLFWNNLYLYARPVNPVYAYGSVIHHYEVPLGLQET